MNKIVFGITFLLALSPVIKAQWVQQYTGNPSVLFTTNFIDENNGFAAGDNEAFLRTTNGGIDWIVLHQGGSTDFHADMFFIDSQTGWTVLGGWTPFRHGYILKTTNGGVSWMTQYYLNDFLFISVFFIDYQIGWAVGTNGIIFKTTNGGTTWTFQYQLPTYEWLYDVYFIDQNIGWAVGNIGNKMLKTTNGGNYWQWIWSPSSDFLLDLEFNEQNQGIAVGENGRILVSIDGGNSWNISQSGTNAFFRDVEFSSTSELWAVGYGGTILSSTDIGSTWQSHYSGTSTDLYSASFVNELKGWVCGNDQLILHNTNGTPVELISFSAYSKESAIVLVWTTATETNNSGFEIERCAEDKLWRTIGYVDGNGTSTNLNNYLFRDDLFGVNSITVYYRLKQIDYNGNFEYSGEIELKIAPSDYYLYQNYPNPFNPSTTITFNLPQYSYVVCIILNSVGEEISKVADGVYTAGTHEIILNAENFSSGLYIYKIQAVGNDGNVWSESRKMILLK